MAPVCQSPSRHSQGPEILWGEIGRPLTIKEAVALDVVDLLPSHESITDRLEPRPMPPSSTSP